MSISNLESEKSGVSYRGVHRIDFRGEGNTEFKDLAALGKISAIINVPKNFLTASLAICKSLKIKITWLKNVLQINFWYFLEGDCKNLQKIVSVLWRI